MSDFEDIFGNNFFQYPRLQSNNISSSMLSLDSHGSENEQGQMSEFDDYGENFSHILPNDFLQSATLQSNDISTSVFGNVQNDVRGLGATVRNGSLFHSFENDGGDDISMELERLSAMDPSDLVTEFERFENALFGDCDGNPAHVEHDAMLNDQDNIFLDANFNLIPSDIFHTMDPFNVDTEFARFENALSDDFNNENAINLFGADLGVNGNGNLAHSEQADDALMLNDNFNLGAELARFCSPTRIKNVLIGYIRSGNV